MLVARDSRHGEDMDVDGIDATGQERRLTENCASSRDYSDN